MSHNLENYYNKRSGLSAGVNYCLPFSHSFWLSADNSFRIRGTENQSGEITIFWGFHHLIGVFAIF